MVAKFSKAKTADQLISDALQKPTSTVVAESGAVTNIPAEPAAPAEPPASRAGQGAPAETGADPWEQGNERVISYFQLRLPEPLKMKLDWLHAQQSTIPGQKKKSQHQIALEAFERAINHLVAKAKGK